MAGNALAPSSRRGEKDDPSTHAALSNVEIAHRLASLAQLLAAKRENPYKIKAYRRAAETIANLPESVDALVRQGADLTSYAGIGKGISAALAEIVRSGKLTRLENLRAEVSPELAALSAHPRLDPRRVLQAYKKLGISSIDALKEKLESGEVAKQLGTRTERHLRSALTDAGQLLLYDAEDVAATVRTFLIQRCGAVRAEVVGDVRRRVEVVSELSLLVATGDFPALVERLKHYGGHAELVSVDEDSATLKLPAGVLLRFEAAAQKTWGIAAILSTGADAHLEKLAKLGNLEKLRLGKSAFADERSVYRHLGLAFIEPELREGRDEVTRAKNGTLPKLVTLEDIRGELHAHSTSSDGAHTIEAMAEAARARGYRYIGITDHSQSLKIAGGVSEADLRAQLRRIDRLNAKLSGFQILKSAEVDILADGTLDYPDDLLTELDYTVCSIHSRFGLNKVQQTERILRAMDNRHFTILGHATGRLLLRRPGYEIDVERIVAHAKARGCFFEINSSPDRLDLSAEHARLANEAGVKIAICTDAHSVSELDFIRWGLDQARRAGLEKDSVLNCLSWPALQRMVKR